MNMIDTQGRHYELILETRRKDESGILFLETTEGDFCSYKLVRKVLEINLHKKKKQLMGMEEK